MEFDFEWDPRKDRINQRKHGVAFHDAQRAFLDPERVIYHDSQHSTGEPRFFCLGMIEQRVMTVRFTYRDGRIRIFGAGYWRKGRAHYEQRN